MIIGVLPDDIINLIFDYIRQVLDFRCIQCCCRYFNQNSLKKYIDDNITRIKNTIKNIYPELIIRYVGGYNDILHYYLFDKCFYNIKNIENLTLKSLHNYSYITSFVNNNYNILLGRYSDNQGFISFSVKSLILQSSADKQRTYNENIIS